MGQYHYLVNLTKKEFVHPHRIGNGLKLREQVGWEYSTSTVLVMLLAASNGRGGGDFVSNSPLIGSWAGDRIAFIGDYAEKGDLSKKDNADLLMERCYIGEFRDISDQVREMMGQEFNITYSGDGWLEIQKKSDLDFSVSKTTT